MNKRDAHIEALKIIEGLLSQNIHMTINIMPNEIKVDRALRRLRRRLKTRIDRLVKDPRLPFPDDQEEAP